MKTSLVPLLVTRDEAIVLIQSGAAWNIAGPEAVLDQLPCGRWIGGTSSYFMTEHGGMKSSGSLLLTPFPVDGSLRITHYAPNELEKVVSAGPENGFSSVIVPFGSQTLQRFAEASRFWPEIFLKPVIGWVAGIDLSQAGEQQSYVYNGQDGTKHSNAMVVAHVTLPPGRLAALRTVNIFDRDLRHTIRFPGTGFEVTDCTINGIPARLADFLVAQENGDGRLPLVGDFAGASINVSVQSIDSATRVVKLYAPVFADVEYSLARPVHGYAALLAEEIETLGATEGGFSCNCILNYLYGEMDGKRAGNLIGPVTFGEIAYLLHNQTWVFLEISSPSAHEPSSARVTEGNVGNCPRA